MRVPIRRLLLAAAISAGAVAALLVGCQGGGGTDASSGAEAPDAADAEAGELTPEAADDAMDEGGRDATAVSERDGPRVAVSGKVFPFVANLATDPTGGRVTILEHPGREYVVADAEGRFVFDDLIPGTWVTLALAHPDFHPIQTETITLPPGGAERVTFQAADAVTVAAFSGILGLDLDPERCQMVTTVTDVGGTLWGGDERGEAGVTVTVEPPLPAEHGPIYFNANVLPDRSLTETSRDGGVLFVNVPPGEYTWTAHKEGLVFRQIRMGCRAGWLTNASPPWGLQVQE